MKLSRITACLLSLLTAATVVTVSVTAFAEGDSPGWADSDEIEPEDPEDPEDIEPEDIEPEATETSAPPDEIEPEETSDDEENDVPSAVLDPDDPPAYETTSPPETTTAAPAPRPEASYTPEAERTMYAPQVINIRTGPGTDYDKLGVLYANSEITVIGSSGEWAAVSYNGSTGYILRSLLSATPPATTTAAPETVPPPAEESTPEADTLPSEPAPIETEPTAPPETEPSETTAPIEFTPEETTTRSPLPAAEVEKTNGGFPPFLLALLAGLAAFLLIGALPVFIHRVHHKNLYRY